jgi:hypothetical protein
MEVKNIQQYKRNCDGCTKCCDGWLAANIHGYNMYPGKPCHFVKKDGCGIYNKRPKEPCKIFKCEWLTDLTIPEWLHPKNSGVIILKKNVDNIHYLQAVEAGKKLSVETLNWLILKFINDRINILYEISGGKNWLGSKEFIQLIKDKKI